jgi:hypothetical protein
LEVLKISVVWVGRFRNFFQKKLFLPFSHIKRSKFSRLARLGRNFDRHKCGNTFWPRPNLMHPECKSSFEVKINNNIHDSNKPPCNLEAKDVKISRIFYNLGEVLSKNWEKRQVFESLNEIVNFGSMWVFVHPTFFYHMTWCTAFLELR